MNEQHQLGADSVFAWHWLKADMTTGEGYEPPWTVGETRHCDGAIALCHNGYHHSPTPFDGLDYAPGPILCRVEASVPVEGEGDTYVSRSRRLIAYRNVERELRLFACACAERALMRERERGREPDERSWRAVEVSRRYAMGEADKAELVLAAESAAARSAWSAAWSAALSAARAAAESAAAAAARSAWSAESAAESAAGGTAERAWQKERFNSTMIALFALFALEGGANE